MRKMSRGTLLFVIVITLLTPSFAAQQTGVRIEFTQVPPTGAGPESRGDITGRVMGLERPETYKIVLYAHTDLWYVQPLVSDPYTDIASDGRWSNWTHLGHRYAALVVRSTFLPPPKTQSLPRVGGDVIARGEISAKVN